MSLKTKYRLLKGGPGDSTGYFVGYQSFTPC